MSTALYRCGSAARRESGRESKNKAQLTDPRSECVLLCQLQVRPINFAVAPDNERKRTSGGRVELHVTFSWRFLIRLKYAALPSMQHRCSASFINCFSTEGRQRAPLLRPRHGEFAYYFEIPTWYLNAHTVAKQRLREITSGEGISSLKCNFVAPAGVKTCVKPRFCN